MSARAAAVAALAALALATPAGAAPRAVTSVTDARGDWAVASADVLSLRVGNAPGTTRGVTFEIGLAAAPDATTSYGGSISGLAACDSWSFEVRGLGTAAQSAAFERIGYCPGTNPPLVPPAAKLPATVTVRGSTVVVSLPYTAGICRGLRVVHLSAIALTAPAGACSGSNVTGVHCVFAGDDAGGKVSYVLR